MTHISVTTQNKNTFHVVVTEDGTHSEHTVTMTDKQFERYGHGMTNPEQLIHASFEFLLKREPKESILSNFSLDTIERYFQEYPNEMQKRLT